jgi:hypothetical protein
VDTKTESGSHASLLAGYLTEAQLAEELNKHVRTVQRWRALGIGPPYVMAGMTPKYSIQDAHDWLAAGGTAAPKPHGKKGCR